MVMMKKLVLPKRILGLFILLLIGVPFINVQAADSTPKCNTVTSREVIARYNLSFHPKKSNAKKFVIKMNPTEAAAKKVKFKIVSVNGKAYTDPDNVVDNDGNLKIATDWVKTGNGDEKKMSIVLESTKKNADPKFCTGKNSTIMVTLEYVKGGEAYITPGEIIDTDLNDDYGELTTKGISCPGKTDLEKLFCKAKENAQNKIPNAQNAKNFENQFPNEKTFQDVKKDLTAGKPITFNCDYKTLHSPESLKGKDENGNEKYYVNKSYMYGSGAYTMKFNQYQYHYNPDSAPERVDVTCRVKCEEAVVVEYGPPIASKAGLCFEYKIKVTSIVSCNLDVPPTPPNRDKSYCTPTPICVTQSGKVVNQGGPNEEFDSCIKSCDGGKYSEKCSTKCYNEVYGKSGVTNTTLSLTSAAVQKLTNAKERAKKHGYKYVPSYVSGDLATCISITGNGCYRRDADGVIHWHSGNPKMAGRWYNYNCPSGYEVFEDNGICRHNYGTDYCHDTCWWSGCEGATYLNPGIAEKDYEVNKKIYQNAKKVCQAKASCSETTAEFTISVDYWHNTKNEENKKESIKFPYSTETDKLFSKSNNKDNTFTILDNNGCYKDKTESRWYQAEWSFPGTWINNKTGEITYEHVSGTGWQSLPQKFCIPIDALNVNERWWNYYYSKVEKNYTPSYKESTNYADNCGNNSGSITNPTGNSPSPEKWNIHGSTKKFGFYEWDIDIDCFYALNSNPSSVPPSDSSLKDEKCKTGEGPEIKTNYRIRSVDLNNLFPATDGANLANKTTSGRTPGFNWSKYATITPTKNSSYNSNPLAYMGKVQSLGYNVYSDANLDYEFTLTKDVLRDLRKVTKENGKNYTNFGTNNNYKSDSDGVSHYRSDDIRRKIPNRRVPESSNMYCNNMVNWHTMKCDRSDS